MTSPGSSRAITILDTTLRDGDQSPGCALSPREKLDFARLLDDAGIDIIEAGFPVSSPVDFEACRLVAEAGLRARVAVMSRCRPEDIQKSASVFASSCAPEKSVLHLSLPVSSAHMRLKLGMEPTGIIHMMEESVRFAAGLSACVEIGAEDATRADREFLADYCAAAVAAGAAIVNIADTAGVANPQNFADLIRFLVGRVPAFGDGRATLSAHCHNDLGLATANTLAAIGAGATQIETTIAGVGERGGNACFEEVAANLLFAESGGASGDLRPLSRALSALHATDYSIGRPVFGRNVRAHASGMHQDGVILDPALYNPVASTLASAGALPPSAERIALSRHSGRSGLARAVFLCTGLSLSPETVRSVLGEIKADDGGTRLFGISELLASLHRRGFVGPAPLQCFTIKERAIDGTFSLSCLTGESRESARRIEGSGDSWTLAVISVARKIFPGDIEISSIASSSYVSGEFESPEAYRVAVEASVAKGERPYAIERYGQDFASAAIACVLDIVNAERARASVRA